MSEGYICKSRNQWAPLDETRGIFGFRLGIYGISRGIFGTAIGLSVNSMRLIDWPLCTRVERVAGAAAQRSPGR
jgi:hypothetical protein